jgi:TPR repeat protein
VKYRTLLSLLLLLHILIGRSTAQQSFDSKQPELKVWYGLKTMEPSGLQALIAKAQSGDAEAQYWLGLAYEAGRLLPKDTEQAARWLLKSAEQDYAPAQGLLGLISVHVDPSVGQRWMMRAAEQGDAETQFWLGVAYEQNWFGITDVNEALKWYQKGAEGGNPDAQFTMGQKYEDGEGAKQSFKLAAEWYQRAAEHVLDLGGAGQGRNRLGLLYMAGRGVPQDYGQAYFWFTLGGNEGLAADAESHMSLAQIRQAQRLVNEWKEQHRLSPELAAAALPLEN